MIDYVCSTCGEQMNSPDSLAGQMETCPACGNATTVPSPEVAKDHPAQDGSLPTATSGVSSASSSDDGALLADVSLEDFWGAVKGAEQGEDQGIGFLFDLIGRVPPDAQCPDGTFPVPGAMGALERSLESAAAEWHEDRLKQALSLSDCCYHYMYQHDWMNSPDTEEVVVEAARIHYLAREELGKRGAISVEPDAHLRELIRRLETDFYQHVDEVINELAELGPKAAPAIPSLVSFYEEHLSERWMAYEDPVIKALEAIGEEAADALKHLQKLISLAEGNYTVCGPCEARMERVSGVGYKCPKCGRLEKDSNH